MHRRHLGRVYTVIVIAALVALYLLPRLWNLDAFVTTDESTWLRRSAHFYDAIFTADFAETFQFAHPGVMTMWAGMVGFIVAAPDYLIVSIGNLFAGKPIHEQLERLGHNELDVLNAARIAKIVLQTALFVVSLIYLRRLFGRLITVIAAVMIALDPFLIAHDRLLHVDGLFTISIFAAVLAIADALVSENSSAWSWFVAGMLAAVAWLTRSTGLVLLVVLAISMLVDVFRADFGSETFRQRLIRHARSGGIWGVAALATTILLWPALWVAPVATLDFVYDWSVNAAGSGHEFPTFFNGTIYFGDPGVWFYPTAFAWRLTVAATVGIALVAMLLVTGKLRDTMSRRAQAALAVALLFALLYGGGMSAGAKKFDRYILPIFPVVDLVAAVGVAGTLRYVIQSRPQFTNIAVTAAVAILALGQALPTMLASPYYLDEYNPLLGDTSAAVDVLQAGWGEGSREAAEFIIADSEARQDSNPDDPPVVRISGTTALIDYLLPDGYDVDPGSFITTEDWRETDYYVSSIQHWQRDMFEDLFPYLEQFDPAHTVEIGGVPFMRVYRLNQLPPPTWLPQTRGCQTRFEDVIQLENITHDSESITIWFRTNYRALPHGYDVQVALLREVDGIPSGATVVTEPFEPSRQFRIVKGLTIPANALDMELSEPFLVQLAVVDPTTGKPLYAQHTERDGVVTRVTLAADCGTRSAPDWSEP